MFYNSQQMYEEKGDMFSVLLFEPPGSVIIKFHLIYPAEIVFQTDAPL